MHLEEEVAKQIIDLNPYPKKGIIDPEVAERQFQVILKGFNYLIQPDNNFLYIGDEVGLGKTYIALGIASLLRLYSDNPESYVDTILVPKENLQYKWLKEIRNFIRHNYKVKDNIVKTVLRNPVGRLNDNTIKSGLSVFVKDAPKYVIYRNSSFSIASDNNEENNGYWIQRLAEKLPDKQKELFVRISKQFKNNDTIIKRAFAYLLNQDLPEIDLLIVDEAHNFKHGIGQNVSIRNQTVSRILGANQSDDELFEKFPELKESIKPKVKKLILLSATPINSNLLEIKNQLDCFLSQHRFSQLENDENAESKINEALNEFMIRGVMTIKVNNKPYSRNGYRHEHRLGNVDMSDTAVPQRLKDNETSLFLCLMQYKTIKELKLKCGNQFEMGMLAGFESFQKSSSNYEDETLFNRKDNEAKDDQIVKEIVDSYNRNFKTYPPHPKQESLVEELFQLIIKREKALVFVRRIASVRELERKLFKKYSDYLIDKIKTVTKGSKIYAIKQLLQSYEMEFKREGIETTLDLIAERIKYELKFEFRSKFDIEDSIDQIISKDLREIYYSLINNSEIEYFKNEVNSHVGYKNIKKELKETATSLIIQKWNDVLILEDEEENDENTLTEKSDEEEKAPYFFQRFFYNEGKNFKARSYKKDWYEMNLLLFNDKFNLFELDEQLLSKQYSFFDDVVDIKRFQGLNEIATQAIKSKKNSKADIQSEFYSNTFITELLLDLCDEEFSEWVNSHKHLIQDKYYTRFLDEIETLSEIIKSIFRQGSGQIPAFVAETKTAKNEDARKDFIMEMKSLLLGEFDFVLDEIKDVLKDYEKIVERNFDDINKIRYNLIQQLPIAGISGKHKKNVRKTAIQFRMPGYPYVLITTDILKEGEDLHSYCKNIYHYGIAWNPSDMEQRTGRVDRIDSMAYRLLKKAESEGSESIPFLNKLQVFYPYLIDTLEVNQMIRLFKGMDKFIDIFYNDLSVNIKKESKANVDDIVEDIPMQREGLLESKYDHNLFDHKYNGEKLKVKNTVGTSFDELLEKLKHILNGLDKFEYVVKPELDSRDLIISGIMKLDDNRHGPFKLYFKHNSKPGEFSYFMESVLGRIQVLGKSSNKQKLNEKLNEYCSKYNLNLRLKDSNSFVYVVLKDDYTRQIDEIIEELYKLVEITDIIEAEVIGIDEKFE